MNIIGSIFKSLGTIIIFPIIYFLLFAFQGVLGIFGFYIGKLFSILILPINLIDTYLYSVPASLLIGCTIMSLFLVIWRMIHLIKKIFLG